MAFRHAIFALENFLIECHNLLFPLSTFFPLQPQPVRAHQEEQLPGIQSEPDPAVLQLDSQVSPATVRGEHHPL